VRARSVERVHSYLAEAYVARPRASELRAHERRARAAAKQLTQQGIPIRFLRSIFVPADEICFYVFEAISAEAVGAACERAALRFERVVEAVDSRKERR
jgi:hypothetical protein